jgi:pimeloyl-ACP methyl ester carboxylesterase
VGIQSYLASPHIQTLLDNVQSKDFLTSEMVSSLPQKNIAFSWGAKDQMLRYQDREWWKKTLPAHATVSEPEEFGHFPIWDNPDLLTEHVCDLAARVDKSEDSAPC